MKKPIRYRGRRPIPVSAETMSGILKTLAKSGKQHEFFDELASKGENFDLKSRMVGQTLKFDLNPKIINTLKDFCYANDLHEGNEEHHRFVSDVIYSPPEGCPDYQDRNNT